MSSGEIDNNGDDNDSDNDDDLFSFSIFQSLVLCFATSNGWAAYLQIKKN